MKKLIYPIACLVLLSCGRNTDHMHPQRKDVTETVFASGYLEPDGKYNLTAQTDGYIIELRFDDGDTVTKDQILALVDNRANNINAESAENLLGIASRNASAEGPTLKQAQQNLALYREKYIQDSIQLVRYQKLFQTNSVSKLEVENMKLSFETSRTNYQNADQNYKLLKQQTEQQLIIQKSQTGVNNVNSDYNKVKAVIGGRVYKRMKQVGDFVKRGDVLAVIGSTDLLYARLSVDESNIKKVKEGQSVVLQLNTDKEKNYNGTVAEIYPSFDDQTQSFYCKVLFKQRLDFKISGTQLQANIIIGEKKNALVIPKTFLGYGNKVKVNGKGDVTVKTGFVGTEWVEIVEGLNESDEIISEK